MDPTPNSLPPTDGPDPRPATDPMLTGTCGPSPSLSLSPPISRACDPVDTTAGTSGETDQPANSSVSVSRTVMFRDPSTGKPCYSVAEAVACGFHAGRMSERTRKLRLTPGLLSALESIDRDWCSTLSSPEWPNTGRVHDWRNYIPDLIRDAWSDLSLDARACCFLIASASSDAEHWD